MRTLVFSLATAALLAAATPAVSQAPSPGAIPKGAFFKGQAATQYLARDRLIGSTVQNLDGQIIGDIEDLIVGTNNEIEGVVMGTGGFLGAGEKRVGVRLSALQFTERDGRSVIVLPAATKEVLDALPEYQRAFPRKSLTERAKEKAQELTDKTKETAGPAYERAKEKAKSAYESAREQAGPAYQRAQEAAKEAYEKAMHAAKEAYDKATESPEPKKQ